MRGTTARLSQSVTSAIGASFATPALLQTKRFLPGQRRPAQGLRHHERVLSNLAHSPIVLQHCLPGANAVRFRQRHEQRHRLGPRQPARSRAGRRPGRDSARLQRLQSDQRTLQQAARPARGHRGLGGENDCGPTVANVKVYVGGMGAALVYGNGNLHRRPDHQPGWRVISQTRLRVTLGETAAGATILHNPR